MKEGRKEGRNCKLTKVNSPVRMTPAGRVQQQHVSGSATFQRPAPSDTGNSRPDIDGPDESDPGLPRPPM